MPINLLLPVVLRLAGPLAFIGAALGAGAMNRSIIIVPILALAGTVTAIIIRKVTPSPMLEVKNLLDPNAPQQAPRLFDGFVRRLLLGSLGYGLVFGLAALIAAVFHTTEFEPQVRPEDAWFILVPALIALVGAWLSARIGISQMTGMAAQMQDMFAHMNPQSGAPSADDDAFTVEGEIIDPDTPDGKDS